jgi:hypothetical protein
MPFTASSCRHERRVAVADHGIGPRGDEGGEHVLVPIGHYVGAGRAGQEGRQHQDGATSGESRTLHGIASSGLRWDLSIAAARRPGAVAMSGRRELGSR